MSNVGDMASTNSTNLIVQVACSISTVFKTELVAEKIAPRVAQNLAKFHFSAEIWLG